jgi:eukaryotic-like serine/threonine-protein kinase
MSQMTGSKIELGPFDALELIGRGGMAEVWRGLHRGQRTPVAIKVITAARAQEPRFLDTFQTEVQSAARLDHPGIVMVLDHGQVSKTAEERSSGKLVAGSPFLVMELASHGSLDRVRGALDWRDLRRTLLALLDALAHAHARGVVHRDLKPANVLLSSSEDLRPGLKLTDFGIAHALGEDGHPSQHEATATSGTPHFMAPEQFFAQWRDYGPWTDLYALGCLAHTLASGRPPFEGKGPMQVAWAHVNSQPPPIQAEHPIPPAFQAWVSRLLAKDPRERFQRAADASWSLRQLDEEWRRSGEEKRAHGARWSSPPAGADPLANPPVFPPGSAEDLAASERATAVIARYQFGERNTIPGEELATIIEETMSSSTLPWWGDHDSGVMKRLSFPPGEAIERPSQAPPMPETWQHTVPPGPSLRLVGAGLGLYGLRSIPMVDRTSERDAIWNALMTVRATGAPRAILLVGSAGNGKSRLVEWMSDRADEVGSAIVLKATHSPIPSPSDGLPRMIARYLRTIDLSREELLARLKKMLVARGVSDEYEWNALTELLMPSTEEQRQKGGAVRFGNAKERHQLVRRLIGRLAEERPVIVWLDDIQWGADTLAFAAHVLRSPSSPILMLLTAREEVLIDRAHESELIAELLRSELASRLEVPPLSPGDHQHLVQELLSLEPELAREVAERTNGNPLFAVQLVGDWVQRGVLELGSRGFRLKPGERALLPDNIHQVWAARIAQVLSHHPESAGLALEIAAVLGTDVDMSEWKSTCQQENVTVPPTLMLDLIASRLAEPTQAGWMFSHGMVRESLERSAGSTWRWREHHLAAASMLRRHYGLKVRGVAERVARHLLAADALEAALEPLLQAARERWETSDFEEAHQLLDQRERVLFTIDPERKDERWGLGWVLKAQVFTVQARFDESLSWAEKAEQAARASKWPWILAEALREQALVAYERGEHSRSNELYRRALSVYEDIGDHQGTVRCLFGLGDVAYRLGDLEGAEELYQRTYDLSEPVEDRIGMADGLWGLGYIALWRGALDRAQECFERQLALLEALGSQLGVARCYNSLGEVSRLSGDLERAAERYRHSHSIHKTIGSLGAMVAQLNLVMVLLGRGQFSEAHRVLDEIFAEYADSEERGHLVAAYCELLPCRSEIGDWKGWDAAFEKAVSLLRETALKDGDVAWTLQLAGDRALLKGERARARRAYALSLEMWRALGREDKAALVEAQLG